MPRRLRVVGSAVGRMRGASGVGQLGTLALQRDEQGLDTEAMIVHHERESIPTGTYPGFHVGHGAAVGARTILPCSAVGPSPEVLLLRWRERTGWAVAAHRARYLLSALLCYPLAN